MLNGSKAASLRWAIPAAVACAAVSAALFTAQPAQADEFDSSIPVGNFQRIAGTIDLDTNAKIVAKYVTDNKSYDKKNVILVTNALYQDALTSSALAGALKCPIVMTAPTQLSQQSKDALSGVSGFIISDKNQSAVQIKAHNKQVKKENLEAGKTINVYIVGGEKVVYKQVEADLKELSKVTGAAYNVVRVAGAEAPDTAAKVAEQIEKIKQEQRADNKKDLVGNAAVQNKQCYITTSVNYFDALSISATAASEQTPIFLTNNYNKLDKKVLDQMKKDGYNKVTIIGGPNAVDKSVEDVVRGLGITDVTRIYGETGYDTSSAFARLQVNDTWKAQVSLATGWGAQDAMSAAPLAAMKGSPILIADESNYAAALDVIKAMKDKDRSVQSGTIYGGPSVVSEKVRLAFEDATSDLKVTLLDADGNVINQGGPKDTTSRMWFFNNALKEYYYKHDEDGKIVTDNKGPVLNDPQDTVYYNAKDQSWYLARATKYITLNDLVNNLASKGIHATDEALQYYTVKVSADKNATAFNEFNMKAAYTFAGLKKDGHTENPDLDEQIALQTKLDAYDKQLIDFARLVFIEPVTEDQYPKFDRYNNDSMVEALGKDGDGKTLKEIFKNIANTKDNKEITKAEKDSKIKGQYEALKKLLAKGNGKLDTVVSGVKTEAEKVQKVKDLLIKNPDSKVTTKPVTEDATAFANFDYPVLGGKDKVQAAHDKVDFGLHAEFAKAKAKEADKQTPEDKAFMKRWTDHTMELENADKKFTPCLAYEYFTVKIDGANSEVKPLTDAVKKASEALTDAINKGEAINNPSAYATYLDKKFVGGDTAYYNSVDKARLMQGVITKDFFHVDRLATNLPGDVSNVVLQTYTPKNN